MSRRTSRSSRSVRPCPSRRFFARPPHPPRGPSLVSALLTGQLRDPLKWRTIGPDDVPLAIGHYAVCQTLRLCYPAYPCVPCMRKGYLLERHAGPANRPVPFASHFCCSSRRLHQLKQESIVSEPARRGGGVESHRGWIRRTVVEVRSPANPTSCSHR